MDACLMTRMKELDKEKKRLKKMYAEKSMQNDLLKEALGKKWGGRLKDPRWPSGQCATDPPASHWHAGRFP